MYIAKHYERLRLGEGSHLAVAHHSVTSDHPIHWHSYFEIEIVISGSGKYVINDVAYDIDKYNMFFMTPTDFHYVGVDTPIEVINISFDDTMISDSDIGRLTSRNTEKAYAFSPDDYRRIAMAAELLEYECVSGGNSQRLLLQYVLNCILGRLQQSSTALPRAEHSRGVKTAIQYMELHFREDISLASVAAEVGYHPAYFSELFKRTTGETFMEMLTKLRIGYARSMLLSGFSVSDACFLSGFGSLSNFSFVFKKHFNISPGAYKARQLATENK